MDSVKMITVGLVGVLVGVLAFIGGLVARHNEAADCVGVQSCNGSAGSVLVFAVLIIAAGGAVSAIGVRLSRG